jgi:hypothetical protein
MPVRDGGDRPRGKVSVCLSSKKKWMRFHTQREEVLCKIDYKSLDQFKRIKWGTDVSKGVCESWK